jgi:hypothetical protein
MKHIILLLFLVQLHFCQVQKDKKDLDLQILNTELVSKTTGREIQNVIRYKNFLYDSVQVNKIDLKITNQGTKTYILFIEKKFDKVVHHAPDNIKMDIYHEGKIFPPTYSGLSPSLTAKEFEMKRYMNSRENEAIELVLNRYYLKEKIDISEIRFQREMNCIIIHPKEVKYLSFYRTLPIFLEDVSSYYVYNFNKEKKYYVKMSLANNKPFLKKHLTANQVREIEDNGYNFLEGKLESNAIPVRFAK